jgi:hypothetical protein
VIIGGGEDFFNHRGWRYRRGVGATLIPYPSTPEPFTSIYVTSLSADGNIVIGYTSKNGIHAYRWTAESGSVLLPELDPGGGVAPQSGTLLISPDGQRIYGSQKVGPGPADLRGCRWEPDGSIRMLQAKMNMTACNRDGSIVVGHWSDVPTPGMGGATIYDDANGYRRLQTMLVDDFGLELGGRTIVSAQGCSWDARLICGSSAIGNVGEAFLARVPLPGDVYADISGDLRVDVKDAKPFTNCLNGPGGATWGTCRAADLDGDGDVDLRDFVHVMQPLIADPCPRADVTGDCEVTDADWQTFLPCLAGPADENAAPLPPACAGADIFADGAADLRDFVMLQRAWPTPP